MNNSGLKITILIVAVILVVGAVLFYIRTIVSPPTKIEQVNQHQQVISQETSRFSGTKSMLYNDSLYDALIDKIAVFTNNELVDKRQSDSDKEKLLNAYVPLFKTHCLKEFQKPGWGESCFNSIRKRISELRTVKYTNKTAVLQGVNANDIREVEDIMKTYASAKTISTIRSYKDVSSARRNINEAAKYLNTNYIKVSNLKNGLEKVKPSIAESHYKYVEGQVHRLRNYRNMTEENFNSLVASVNATIKEYKDNKSMYGTYAREVSTLESEAGSLISSARQYYASLARPTISVYLGGWQTYTDYACPAAYTPYRSYSNLNVASGKSTMSFTIKGYETFSMQVKCSSENCCDYLLVGYENQNVTDSYYKWSSKGNANALTWQTITYYGLDKSRSYNISVQYIKDGSVNSGDDRAYIRLPKTN